MGGTPSMTPKTINTFLWTAAVACVGGAALSVALAAVLPLDDAPAATTHTSAPASTQPVESLAPLFVLDDSWSRPLRAGLEAAPANASSASTQTSSGPPQLTLVGTIGHSIALLQNGASVEAAAVGDTVAGASVLSIRPSAVEIRYNDRVLTLTKPAEDPGP